MDFGGVGEGDGGEEGLRRWGGVGGGCETKKRGGKGRLGCKKLLGVFWGTWVCGYGVSFWEKLDRLGLVVVVVVVIGYDNMIGRGNGLCLHGDEQNDNVSFLL